MFSTNEMICVSSGVVHFYIIMGYTKLMAAEGAYTWRECGGEQWKAAAEWTRMRMMRHEQERVDSSPASSSWASEWKEEAGGNAEKWGDCEIEHWKATVEKFDNKGDEDEEWARIGK